jgi:hypothetical protein
MVMAQPPPSANQDTMCNDSEMLNTSSDCTMYFYEDKCQLHLEDSVSESCKVPDVRIRGSGGFTLTVGKSGMILKTNTTSIPNRNLYRRSRDSLRQ